MVQPVIEARYTACENLQRRLMLHGTAEVSIGPSFLASYLPTGTFVTRRASEIVGNNFAASAKSFGDF